MAEKQYKALQPVGRFKPGDYVAGLSEEQVTGLLAAKVIEEVAEEAETKPAAEVKATTNKTNKEVKVDG
ncbi:MULTISPECIES: hypothetical protein [unclassified Acinetobacter]|uniref:hypothetical protein n=1 Tax=unclassified Acinetobacter TaxID=196816 RepID=UPI0024482A34|nr:MULTISPECIES: hypothetical protein [unclassified Acinetobacter]MDH0031340.1 hypothetical protein [Acinetobacter sp. GD04021]MDH0887175.1 hypothetical protein [Acinetobacter sp. GD03873]MDH1083536.1 hypothetical protein [Acinetobacter sp. GD03983]MDH2190491.1 hypothetical protein [Acinetobacter sp. GD03645]MDH2204063.1 hypothetical protein [Acinetobacter sp. GD03647]